jgi:hypothetical protein
MNCEEAVKEYQCSGCVSGPFEKCYKKAGCGCSCIKHVPGTVITPFVGTICLGMPKGFDRIGPIDIQKRQLIYIFESYEDAFTMDKFNIPVWKYTDKFENTLIRGIQPRLNMPFILVILENCGNKFDCYEITENDIENMD